MAPHKRAGDLAPSPRWLESFLSSERFVQHCLESGPLELRVRTEAPKPLNGSDGLSVIDVEAQQTPVLKLATSPQTASTAPFGCGHMTRCGDAVALTNNLKRVGLGGRTHVGEIERRPVRL